MNIKDELDPLVDKLVRDVVEFRELLKTDKMVAADMALEDVRVALNSIWNLVNKKTRT